MLFRMGTVEETKDRPWSWVLSAPIEFVKAAVVDFDPDVRSVKCVQGDTEGKTSALQVIPYSFLFFFFDCCSFCSSSSVKHLEVGSVCFYGNCDICRHYFQTRGQKCYMCARRQRGKDVSAAGDY